MGFFTDLSSVGASFLGVGGSPAAAAGGAPGVVTGPATGGNINVGGLTVPAYPFAGGGPTASVFNNSGFGDKVLVGVAVAAATALLLLVMKKGR